MRCVEWYSCHLLREIHHVRRQVHTNRLKLKLRFDPEGVVTTLGERSGEDQQPTCKLRWVSHRHQAVPRRYSVLQDWMTDLGIQDNPVLEEVGCGLNSSLRLAGSLDGLLEVLMSKAIKRKHIKIPRQVRIQVLESLD